MEGENSLSYGRLILIGSCLGSLPTYFMSVFKALDVVFRDMEFLQNMFFLGNLVVSRS